MSVTVFEKLLDFENNGNHTRNELAVISDYKKVINEKIEDRLKLYESFGPTIRHRVMNMNAYNHNLKFGFTHTNLDKYDWLARPVWDIEKIEFKTTHLNHLPYIEIGKSPNGKYSWGYSFSYGGAGSGCGVHVFKEPINTRNEAFDIAIAYAKKEYTNTLNRNDSTNFKEALINQVLFSINELITNSAQLELF